MSIYQEDQIRMMLDGRETLTQLAKDYFWQRYKADPKWDHGEWFGGFIHTPSITIAFNGDNVNVTGEARACNRGCCGTESHTYSFPLSYLWLDQTAILADMKAKAEAKAKAEEEAKAKQEAEDKKQREADERKRLVELAAKYPDTIKP